MFTQKTRRPDKKSNVVYEIPYNKSYTGETGRAFSSKNRKETTTSWTGPEDWGGGAYTLMPLGHHPSRVVWGGPDTALL